MNLAYRYFVLYANTQPQLFRNQNKAERAIKALDSNFEIGVEQQSQCNVYFNRGVLLVSKPARSRKVRWSAIKDAIETAIKDTVSVGEL